MPHNKKQHFVPQLLQRFFSIDKENIGSFHIKSGRVGPSPIAKTAQKDWLYKVNEKDRTSIEHIFEHIERNAQPIIERIQHKDFTLSSEEIDKLFIFVVAQLMRTPKAAIAMGAVLVLYSERYKRSLQRGRRRDKRYEQFADAGLYSHTKSCRAFERKAFLICM